GVRRDNQRVLNRELRILESGQVDVCGNSQYHQEDCEDRCNNLVAYRCLGNIHGREVRDCPWAYAAPSFHSKESGRRPPQFHRPTRDPPRAPSLYRRLLQASLPEPPKPEANWDPISRPNFSHLLSR